MNIKCDLTENQNEVKKWSDIVAGRSTCRKEEDPTSNRNFGPNITSYNTEEPCITVNRGHKFWTEHNIIHYRITVNRKHKFWTEHNTTHYRGTVHNCE